MRNAGFKPVVPIWPRWAGCTAALLAACTGSIADHGQGGISDPSGGAGTGGGAPLTCRGDAPDPGDAPLRLLTREQYLNTVHDLFGPVNLDAVYSGADAASVFGLVQGDVDQVSLESYQRAAALVGAAVVADKKLLDRVAPCPAGSDQRGCAQAFLQAFGARLYRAPFAAADLPRHLALYDAGAGGGYAHGIEMMVRAMLQSPRFLYRVELGTGEAVGAHAVKLSGYELAARLSYGLWNTTPDDVLVAQAAAGGLATPAGVVAQLQRMVADPRGAAMVSHFLEAWIHLPELDLLAKDATRFPEWNDTLRASMTTGAQSFFDDVMGKQGGTLTALLTSPAARSDGMGAGMLTLPAFLATQAKAGEGSPVYRGKFVREQLLCQELPAPPANVPPAPEIKAGVSTRERFAQHEVDASCSGCHSLMDPIGFVFENYDAIGRFRTTDGGKPVDASGALTATSDADGPMVGVPALAAKLAGSADVQACMARQWFRYALGRFDQPGDACSVRAIGDAFRAAAYDLRALPQAIVQTDAFLYRRPIVLEVKP
jgi:hypothetical protein